MPVFFVMSGYLITSLLLKDMYESGKINFRRFYIRRIFRLVPALAVLLALYFCVAVLAGLPAWQEFKAVLAALFYYMNWLRALGGDVSSFLGHTWSLSVEEQFYTLWPLICAAFWLRFGKQFRFLVGFLCVLAITCMIWRHHLAASGAPIYRLYDATDMRLDALSAGCALALLMQDRESGFFRFVYRVAPVCAPLGAALLFLIGFFASYVDRNWYLWQQAVSTLLSAGLVASIVVRRDTWIHPLFEARVPVFLGRICYGLYIYHFPILELMRVHWQLAVEYRVLLGVPLTFLCAVASYYWIELPLMQRRPR
jgi:peptidoglycan/LPS O-acetylase OafA/YrhL